MDDMRGNKNIYEDDIIRRESRDNYKPRQKMLKELIINYTRNHLNK